MKATPSPIMAFRSGRCAVVALLVLAGLLVPASRAASPPATWTTGHKKVLIIPVRFTDQAGPSDVPNASGYRSGWGNITNGTTAAAINDFFQRSSYGKLSMEFTVLPEINLGVSYTIYNAAYGATGLSKFAAWDEPGSFADDVRAKARQVGLAAGQAALYDSDNYDLDFLLCGFIPGQGTLASGRAHGKGIFGTTSLALAHEFGHNFGLQHANGISRSTFYSPLKGGTFFTDPYGDVFDLMGWKNTTPVPLVPDRDLNPYWKWQIGWLPDANIATPVVSGTYRIHAFDQPTLEAGKNYALRVVRDPSRVYWFSYRQSIASAEAIWSNNGLEVRIGGESIPATGGHTTLLDMTPGSRGLANIPGVTNNPYATLYDAALALGRTYSDTAANLHVTPVKKGGTVPELLDVVLNYGPFPGNGAPTVSLSPASVTLAAGVAQTFTASASDPNGDALAYYWEFDDPDALGGSAAGNTNPDARLSTQGSHTWTRSGTHLVRCTVTDMKGGKTIASATVTVTGGTTALRTISGVVKDENGNPLAGAVVNNYKGGNPNLVRYGATNFVGSSETGADGKYAVQVPAGISGTFYLNVLHQGFTFTCSVAGGAVAVYSASVANVDFTRVRTNRTVSGGVYVAGRGYNPATDGPLTINVNGQNISATNGSWTTTVADGTPLNITATAGVAGNSVFGMFPNPYVVVDDFNLLHFFLNVAGQMPLVGFTSSGASSDDTVGTVNIPVTLTLPPGSNSWPANQFIYYWLDPSSTAEYGVDYKMAGGSISFPGGQVPTPYLIPLKILPTGQPQSKTVVIRLGPASSIVNLGPVTTFTYTITNSAGPPLNAGTIQFAQSAYSVSEGEGSATLVATRTGGSDGIVSGYYRTANGTALAGQDYIPTTNFVTWANGDTTSKNVVVTILDDAAVEPSESFIVTFLTTSGGATLGTPATATVTISDDDIVVVPENHPPLLPPSVILHVPKLIEMVLTNTATDSDLPAQTLTYELLQKPAGATIDANGIVRWTPLAASTNFFQTKVTDNGSPAKSATNSFYVIVTEPVVVLENHAPVLPGSNGLFRVLRLVELVVTNTATDSDLPAQTLTYELLSKPDGATIDADGIVRWTPPTASTNFFQTKVTDSGSPAKSATNSFYVIVTEPVVVLENHAPVLPANLVFRVPKLTEAVVINTATDSDLPAQTLTYEFLSSPAGATISANGVIRWTPPAAGTNYFQIKVTDNGSPVRSATNSLYVIATELDVVAENHTPVLPRPTVVTVKKLTEMVFTNSAVDFDLPVQALTYELLARPDGATIDGEGIIRWTPTLTQGPSTNRFRTKVTDNGSPARSATNVFYVIVTEGNTAPNLYGRSSFTATNAGGVSETYAASDSDTPANTLSFSLVSGPAWLAFTKTDERRAQLIGTPPAVASETHLTAVLQVMDNGTPLLAKQLTVKITLSAAPPAPATCFVVRRLPAGYVPGTALTVSLLITPPADTTAYNVADAPPAGWTVGAISDGGQRDAGTGAINFGPFNDASARTLTYQLTPPVTETGPKSFAGITYRNGAFTGICGVDALIHLQYHPADGNPSDLRLTDAEVTTYVAAWKSGSAWPVGPNPIEVSYVTRAGYLARNGETYTVNPLALLPLAWIPTPRAPIAAKVPTTLTTAPTGKGCWRFVAHRLAVGATTTVALIVNPAATDSAYAVEETPPPGWTVGAVSAGGVYDATAGRVRWGLFHDQTSRTLTYELTPSGALAPFAGVASFDGTDLPIRCVSQPEIVPAITEAEFAPATRLPTGEIVLPLATRDGTVTVIEVSDDFRVWTPIWTNTPGSMLFRELPLNVRAGRFYRSIEQ